MAYYVGLLHICTSASFLIHLLNIFTDHYSLSFTLREIYFKMKTILDFILMTFSKQIQFTKVVQ